MKKFTVVFVVSLFCASMAYAETALSPVTSETVSAPEAGTKSYFCPMDGFTSDKPGKCELCGMDLIEAPAVAAAETAAVPATE